MTRVKRVTKHPYYLAAIYYKQQKNLPMEIILLLIIISLLVALAFLAAFLWAVKDGQYADDHTPALRMLLDDKSSDSTINS